MMEAAGIALFAVIIAGSIALHELGHLVPAKRFGVKVTEYMVGFGPAVWSRRRGETSYGLRAFPVGGYIRMAGMLPPASAVQGASAPKEGPSSGGRFASMVDEARRASMADVGPGDENRVFYRLPVRKRVVIMLGGPAMNLLLAFVLFSAVLVGIGMPQPTTTIGAVLPCTPSAAHPFGDLAPSGDCPAGTAESPASAAGLLPGDGILSVDGQPVSTWQEASAGLRDLGDQEAVLRVRRAGAEVEVIVDATTVERPVFDAQGSPTGQVARAGFIGVSPQFAYVSQGWSSVPAYMWDVSVRSVEGIGMLPVRLYELVATTLVAGGERAMDSPVSVVGVSRLGGEIAAMDEPFEAKAATFLGLAASLNLFLFLFNLLPVLPLDGGHVAGALYEGLRRSAARVRGRPDPGPVDMARLLPVAQVMAYALLAFGLVVIWADIVRPISFG